MSNQPDDVLDKIDSIIQKAEEYASNDKSMFADMDNNPMNRQTLFTAIKSLIAEQVVDKLSELKEEKSYSYQPTPDPNSYARVVSTEDIDKLIAQLANPAGITELQKPTKETS